VNFHPCANNVLASSSADFTVKLWDIEKGDELFTTSGASDLITSVSWNGDGSQLATGCRDKKLRILDPRAQTVVAETICHEGVKGLRALWMGNKNRIFTVGFTKMSEREYAMWDPRSMEKPLCRKTIDSNSGVIMPFYDEENSILYLAGKGDGNIRYYEVVDEEPYIYFLSEYMNSSPQRGMGLLPKRASNVASCEVARLFKIHRDMVEPISFTVPRKSDLFQDDIYPPCFAGNPTMTADEFKGGKTTAPDCTFDHEKGFVASEQKVVAFKPVVKEEKVLSESELKDLVEKLNNRVAFLEAEIVKKDAKLKELEAK
jgi:coronin-1B/1C/6